MVLRVKLEIVPVGYEEKAYEIGRLDIFNKGLAEPSKYGLYSYGVINLTKGDVGLFTDDVFHFRNEGAWKLVKKVIKELKVTGP